MNFLRKYLRNIGIVMLIVFGTAGVIIGFSWLAINLIMSFGPLFGWALVIFLIILLTGAFVTVMEMND